MCVIGKFSFYVEKYLNINITNCLHKLRMAVCGFQFVDTFILTNVQYYSVVTTHLCLILGFVYCCWAENLILIHLPELRFGIYLHLLSVNLNDYQLAKIWVVIVL